MGTAVRPHKVNLVAGLLANDTAMLDRSRDILSRAYGRIDLHSPVTEFTHTRYYNAEMGGGLKRQYLSFLKPVDMSGIWRVKRATNRLERRFSNDGKRRINIDPGYLDLSKLILLSTKDYTHRIHLAAGIFAEVTLFYKDKTFNPWPWTYPDYKCADTVAFFNNVRELYREKMS